MSQITDDPMNIPSTVVDTAGTIEWNRQRHLQEYLEAMAKLPPPTITPAMVAQVLGSNYHPTAKPYEAKLINRVAIPIRQDLGIAGSLEMTLDQKGDQIDLTLILPGR